jgi:hypothetical protein
VATSDLPEILKAQRGPDAPEVIDRTFAALRLAWTREFEDWQTRDLA